jgi:hypothetical protein
MAGINNFMRAQNIQFLVVALVLSCSSVAIAGEWIADKNSNCQAWISLPDPAISMSWSGPCSQGKANGQGTLQWYKNGKPFYRYEGEYKDGKMNGKGILVSSENSSHFEGEFKDDWPFNGKGLFIATNISYSLEGEFKDGHFSGHCISIVEGTRVEGECIDGEVNGTGSVIYHNGSRYEGDFKRGLYNGFGILSIVREDHTLSHYTNINAGEWKKDMYVISGMWANGRLIKSHCSSSGNCRTKH